MSNSIGKKLVLTTFGESHGPAVGGILDGFPAGIEIDPGFIDSELKRRSTGRSLYASSRKEEDSLELLSGIFEGRSTGAPIAFQASNTGFISGDYDHLSEIYRPSHADFTWEAKYGIRDHRGGGRSSARETLARVAGGAFAKMFLRIHGIEITAWVSQIGPFIVPESSIPYSKESISNSGIGCPDKATEEKCLQYLNQLKKEGDTTGGAIRCIIQGVPAGLGEPVFDKLHADLGKAMLSINAAKGFDYGSGFSGIGMKGSEQNDLFTKEKGKIVSHTNFSGGIQGGISNGMDIFFRVGFKPVPSLMKDQETVNRKGEKVILKGKGRHDVCVVPRAIVIVEAMAALVVGDHLLRNTKV